MRCRAILLLATLALPCAPDAARAAEPGPSPVLAAHPAAVRLAFERLRMPGGERPLALAEVAVLADLPASLYAGPALLGAVAGERGGFFVAGVEAGLRLGGPAGLGLDAGLFAGGGGGGSAPVGGGLMLRPRVAATWSARRDRLSAGVSHAVFPTGDIRSSQLFLAWERRFDAAYARDPLRPWEARRDLASARFSRTSLELRLSRYARSGGLRRASGIGTVPSMDLVGLAAGTALAGPLSLRVEGAAAYGGESGGYMEVLAGPALRVGLGAGGRLAAVGALTAGSGGGGGIGTGDGFLVKGVAGLELRPTPSLLAGVEAGALAAPSTSLRAATVAVKLGWELELASPGVAAAAGERAGPAEVVAVSWRLRSSVQRYAASQRRTVDAAPPVDQLAFKADLLLSPVVYLTAQTGWAFAGQAGAWATGLLGAGLETPGFRGHRLGVEGLAGAGGGGGISTTGGALLHVTASWLYELTPRLGVQLSAGRARAVGGRLDSLVLDAGLVFRGASLARASRPGAG